MVVKQEVHTEKKRNGIKKYISGVGGETEDHAHLDFLRFPSSREGGFLWF